MGKHGPCYHCGVTSTPLWRNGPPEKPILCNACGSRWRTKGSLVNYTPLHSRAEPDEYEDYKIPRAKIVSIKHKESNALKRKQNHENKVFKKIAPSYNYGLLKTMETEMSNRSSSGSAISNVSESCVQYGSVDASELTGLSQSVVWDQMVPSRKRTCVNRPDNQSQVEKLTKDLYTILHEQQFSHFSGSSEEDLLFDSDLPMVSVEIGHGSVLIRHPSSIAQEEESEASSISVENKSHLVNYSYSHLPTFPLHVNKVGIENNKRPFGVGIQQEQVNNRDKDEHEKLLILENHNSPLGHVDLKEIINYQVFASHLTNEEQQQLLQLLPDLDSATLSFSLQSMFASPELEEDLLSFQKLLSEGVFDFSFSGVKSEDCGVLKKLALSGSKKSTWVEQYSLLKDKEDKSSKKGFFSRGADMLAYGSSTNVKRLRDDHFRMGSGTKTTMRTPNFNNFVENGGSFFTPRSLFPMLDTFQFIGENSEQDLLLDVPTNNSFPEAELFYQTSPSSSSVYPQLTDPSKAF